jgi:hypothetical protein
MSVCDLRLPPLSIIELCYSGMLTLRRAVILYRRFGTAYGFHLLVLDLTLEDWKIGRHGITSLRRIMSQKSAEYAWVLVVLP